MFPKKITIQSDNTELEYQREEPISRINKETTVTYKYTKATYFLGTEITFTKSNLERMIKSGTAVVVD